MGEKSSLKFDGESSCFTLPLRIFVFFVVPEGNSTAVSRMNETNFQLSEKCVVPEEWKAGIGHDFRHCKGWKSRSTADA